MHKCKSLWLQISCDSENILKAHNRCTPVQKIKELLPPCLQTQTFHSQRVTGGIWDMSGRQILFFTQQQFLKKENFWNGYLNDTHIGQDFFTLSSPDIFPYPLTNRSKNGTI